MSDQQTTQAPPGMVGGTVLAGSAPSSTPPEQGAVTKTPVEASQGVKLGVMRWVLGVSIVLAIIAMVVAYMVA
jgi:hypothetical protein